MGTGIVGVILVAIVAAILCGIRRSKKNGKHLCGGDCARCGACRGGASSPSAGPGGPATPLGKG